MWMFPDLGCMIKDPCLRNNKGGIKGTVLFNGILEAKLNRENTDLKILFHAKGLWKGWTLTCLSCRCSAVPFLLCDEADGRKAINKTKPSKNNNHGTSYNNKKKEERKQQNKKDRWGSGKPRRQQILSCDIQIKLVISRKQIYVYHTLIQICYHSKSEWPWFWPFKVTQGQIW